MGSAGLLGGILQGFTGVALHKQDQRHEDEMDTKRNRIALLTSIDPSTLDESGRQHLGEMLDEALGQKGNKGGKGGGGQYTGLFDKLAPLFDHMGRGRMQAPPRPDGLASPVPGNLNYGGARPQTELDQVNPPQQQGPPPKITNPAEVLQGAAPQAAPPAGPQALENVPRPDANVPRGTIHPSTLGGLWAQSGAQTPVDRRMADADKVRGDFEKRMGRKLTPEEEEDFNDYILTGSASSFRHSRKDEMLSPDSVNPYTNKPARQMRDQYGNIYWIDKPDKPAPKPTAAQQKRQQRVDDYKVVHPNATDAQASQAISAEDYTDELQKRLTNRFRGTITDNQAQESAQRLVNGNPTVKDARYVLKDAMAEAKERVANAMRESKAGYPSTGGTPGPDNNKTEEQIADEVLEGQGFNVDELRKYAAGSAPRSQTPKSRGAATNPNDPMGILN